MVDRYQLGLRIEVLHRVTPRFHDAGDEGIGSSRGLSRLVDESLLHVAPFVRETQAGGFRQRLDIELSPLLLTCAKVRLGGSRRPSRLSTVRSYSGPKRSWSIAVLRFLAPTTSAMAATATMAITTHTKVAIGFSCYRNCSFYPAADA